MIGYVALLNSLAGDPRYINVKYPWNLTKVGDEFWYESEWITSTYRAVAVVSINMSEGNVCIWNRYGEPNSKLFRLTDHELDLLRRTNNIMDIMVAKYYEMVIG